MDSDVRLTSDEVLPLLTEDGATGETAHEQETEERPAIKQMAECYQSSEEAGLSGENAAAFDRALAKRRRREEAACAVVLQRAARGELDAPASTLPVARPLRHHGARSRAKRAAAPRRRGSRRCGRALARAGPSDDPDLPGAPTSGRYSHDLTPLGRRSP